MTQGVQAPPTVSWKSELAYILRCHWEHRDLGPTPNRFTLKLKHSGKHRLSSLILGGAERGACVLALSVLTVWFSWGCVLAPVASWHKMLGGESVPPVLGALLLRN